MTGDPNRLIRALAYAVVAFGVTAGMGVALRVGLDVAMLQGAGVAIALILTTFLVASAGY